MYARRGAALLLAVVLCVVSAVGVLSLWHTAAAARRALRLAAAVPEATALADSVLVRAVAQVEAGVWRALTTPGASMVLESGTRGVAHWRATLGRTAWQTLLLRATSEVSAGLPIVQGRADHRVVIPLPSPLPLPQAAVTGAVAWQIDVGAEVAVPIGDAAERRCRDGIVVAPGRVAPLVAAFDTAALPILDADTVSGAVTGAYRLRGGVLRRPVQLVGLLIVTQGLQLDADLLITGALVVDGSVQTGIGHLDVTGAVLTGDAGGGRSGLGNSDRVHYDACAIRQAVARVTRPAPTATWTSLVLF